MEGCGGAVGGGELWLGPEESGSWWLDSWDGFMILILRGVCILATSLSDDTGLPAVTVVVVNAVVAMVVLLVVAVVVSVAVADVVVIEAVVVVVEVVVALEVLVVMRLSSLQLLDVTLRLVGSCCH